MHAEGFASFLVVGSHPPSTMYHSRGIYDPANVTTFADAQAAAKDFISSRSEWAQTLKKPILLEEFGMVIHSLL